MALRLAMWSGPRNISTAMMRAWGNRPDTFVCDEPLYAYYLLKTGANHPVREEVIATGETDWRKAVDWLTGEVPQGKSIFFQKHMTHHLLSEIDRGWLDRVSNCFLIRDPREVIVSYLRKNGDPTAEDVGYPQQTEIYRFVSQRLGRRPPVLDARDVLQDPRRMLELLCRQTGVAFDECMLSWPPGLRSTDGVWARHWYPEVEHSTGFKPYTARTDEVPQRLSGVERQCQELYQELYEHRLR
jgi:hypothetical protein